MGYRYPGAKELTLRNAPDSVVKSEKKLNCYQLFCKWNREALEELHPKKDVSKLLRAAWKEQTPELIDCYRTLASQFPLPRSNRLHKSNSKKPGPSPKPATQTNENTDPNPTSNKSQPIPAPKNQVPVASILPRLPRPEVIDLERDEKCFDRQLDFIPLFDDESENESEISEPTPDKKIYADFAEEIADLTEKLSRTKISLKKHKRRAKKYKQLHKDQQQLEKQTVQLKIQLDQELCKYKQIQNELQQAKEKSKEAVQLQKQLDHLQQTTKLLEKNLQDKAEQQSRKLNCNNTRRNPSDSRK